MKTKRTARTDHTYQIEIESDDIKELFKSKGFKIPPYFSVVRGGSIYHGFDPSKPIIVRWEEHGKEKEV